MAYKQLNSTEIIQAVNNGVELLANSGIWYEIHDAGGVSTAMTAKTAYKVYLGTDGLAVQVDSNGVPTTFSWADYKSTIEQAAVLEGKVAQNFKISRMYTLDVSADANRSVTVSDYAEGIDSLVVGGQTACPGKYSIVGGHGTVVDANSTDILTVSDGAIIKKSEESIVTGHGVVLKDSKGVALLGGSSQEGAFVDVSYNSVIIGSGAGEYTGISGSVASVHGKLTDVYSSLVAEGGSVDAKHIYGSVLTGTGKVTIGTGAKVWASLIQGSIADESSRIEGSIINGHLSGNSDTQPFTIEGTVNSSVLVGGTRTLSSVRGLNASLLIGDAGSITRTADVTEAKYISLIDTDNDYDPFARSSGSLELLGYGNVVVGSSDYVSVNGCENAIGEWNYRYKTSALSDLVRVNGKPSNSYVTVSGSNNNVPFGTSYVNVAGSKNYLPVHGKNITVIGTGFNKYTKCVNGVLYNCEYSGVQDLKYCKLDEFDLSKPGKWVIAAGGLGEAGQTLSGTEIKVYNGLNSYIEVSGGKAYDRRRLYDMFGTYPAYNETIVSIGDSNTVGDNSVNSMVFGHNVNLGGVKLENSFLKTNYLHIEGKYTSADSGVAPSQHVFSNLWWISPEIRNASDAIQPHPLEVFNYSANDGHSFIGEPRDYSNAFVFSDSTDIDARFFGIFHNPTAEGFTTATLSYACKPSAPMMYTGGIALSGGSSDAGYGLLKLGALYKASNYVETTYKDNASFEKYNGKTVVTQGTTTCPYAGAMLTVMDRQEYDGTFRITAAKVGSASIDYMDSINNMPAAAVDALNDKLSGVDMGSVVRYENSDKKRVPLFYTGSTVPSTVPVDILYDGSTASKSVRSKISNASVSLSKCNEYDNIILSNSITPDGLYVYDSVSSDKVYACEMATDSSTREYRVGVNKTYIGEKGLVLDPNEKVGGTADSKSCTLLLGSSLNKILVDRKNTPAGMIFVTTGSGVVSIPYDAAGNARTYTVDEGNFLVIRCVGSRTDDTSKSYYAIVGVSSGGGGGSGSSSYYISQNNGGSDTTPIPTASGSSLELVIPTAAARKNVEINDTQKRLTLPSGCFHVDVVLFAKFSTGATASSGYCKITITVGNNNASIDQIYMVDCSETNTSLPSLSISGDLPFTNANTLFVTVKRSGSNNTNIEVKMLRLSVHQLA